jgi:steroid delta-isomerase-like uncharacterized protein
MVCADPARKVHWCMRRRQVIVIAGVFIVAAVLAAGVSFAVRSSPSPALVIDAYIAAWNRQDAAGAAAYLAEDVVYFDASVGASVEGRQAVREQVIDNFMAAVPDGKWELTAPPFVQGDKASFQWRFTGTNTGEWGNGTPPSGVLVDVEGHTSSEIVDGKIVREADYYDPAAFFDGAP